MVCGGCGGVSEVYDNFHSGVLIFKEDLIDIESIIDLSAVGAEAGECEGVAKNIDCLELGSGEILVVVFVDTIVIGVEGIEVDATSGKQRQH